MPTLERARAKHNVYVEQFNKAKAKKDKALDVLIRAQAKEEDCRRAMVRSDKRMQKLRTAAVHNTGPTATVADKVLTKVKTKVAPAAKLDDPVPTFKAEAVRAIPYTEAHPHSKMAKKRRTIEDFKADIAKRPAV